MLVQLPGCSEIMEQREEGCWQFTFEKSCYRKCFVVRSESL